LRTFRKRIRRTRKLFRVLTLLRYLLPALRVLHRTLLPLLLRVLMRMQLLRQRLRQLNNFSEEVHSLEISDRWVHNE
jgi:hypothetical protein